MAYKKGDRYENRNPYWYYIYEYTGNKHECIILESTYDGSKQGNYDSFPHWNDKYLGNFSKACNFNNLYDILK